MFNWEEPGFETLLSPSLAMQCLTGYFNSLDLVHFLLFSFIGFSTIFSCFSCAYAILRISTVILCLVKI